MKRTASLLACLLAASLSFAQGVVSGSVSDGATREPLEYATVILYPEGSGKPAGGGLSDTDGKFSYNVPYGTYRVQVSFAGYTAQSAEVSVSAAVPKADPLRFRLTEDAQELQTVEVTGNRSAMRLDVDKKVFDVERGVMTEGASASDILQNMPSVQVDTDGNVTMRNSGAVEIWINGVPSGLSDTDKGDILEMIPAESIKSIELITNPSAKYNPEGSAGIINIVMKDKSSASYLASVSAGLQYQEGTPYPGGNIGFNSAFSGKKWDFSLNLGVRSRKREKGDYTHRSSFADGDTTRLLQTSLSSRDRLNGFLKGALTWHVTEADALGLSAYGMYGANWNRKDLHYTGLGAEGDTLYTRVRDTRAQSDMGFGNVTLDYTHTFRKDREELYAAVNWNQRSRVSESEYTDLTDQAEEQAERFQFQDRNERGGTISAQADYFRKIGKDNKIEAGGKAQWKRTRSEDFTQDSTAGAAGRETVKDNLFNYSERIYALYASYSGKFGWFSLQAGLRGEQTFTTANGHERHYFHLFPSAYLGFALPRDNELQLNYTRRINRPRGRRINNYTDRTDPTDITFGNPDLLPELSNSLELNYLKVWDNHTLTAGVFYRYTQDVIQQLRTDSAGYMTTTYGNLTYDQNAGAELISKNSLAHDRLNLTTTISAYYYQLGGNADYHIDRTETFSWQARLNANVKITDGLSAQLTGYYNAPRLVAQGTVGHEYALDLGLKLSLLKKSLNLSLSCRDLLDSRSRTVRTTYGDGFTQEKATTSVGRNYRLTVSYNFGNMKKKAKVKNRNTDNGMDDDDDF